MNRKQLIETLGNVIYFNNCTFYYSFCCYFILYVIEVH